MKDINTSFLIECKTILNNQILASISPDEYQLLFANLQQTSLTSGQIIYEPHQEIDFVYFPLNSMISLVSTLSNQKTTEIGLIGNQGFVGLPVFLGGNYATNHTVVQIPDGAMKLDAKIFSSEAERPGEFRRILLLYTQARITQISQNIVCKCHHSIKNQFAYWLLLILDSVKKNEFFLTQQFMAQMLGVRRSSVSEVAYKFQELGIIRYKRGKMTILNKRKLKLNACECYDIIKLEFEQLLNFT